MATKAFLLSNRETNPAGTEIELTFVRLMKTYSYILKEISNFPQQPRPLSFATGKLTHTGIKIKLTFVYIGGKVKLNVRGNLKYSIATVVKFPSNGETNPFGTKLTLLLFFWLRSKAGVIIQT